jgi:hypothetical protein
MENRIMTIEELVEVGDKIHNAKEIICLTHDVREQEHDMYLAVIGNEDDLAHLVAKTFCANNDFFKIVTLALEKINYQTYKNPNVNAENGEPTDWKTILIYLEENKKVSINEKIKDLMNNFKLINKKC